MLSRSGQVSDLFSPEANLYRVRMRDHSSRLVMADPIRWGASASDLYWRKSVYHTLAAARNAKKERGWTPMEKAYVVSHLVNAVGHYQHFLWFLLEDFGWSKRVLDKLGVRQIAFDLASNQEEFGYSKMTESA